MNTATILFTTFSLLVLVTGVVLGWWLRSNSLARSKELSVWLEENIFKLHKESFMQLYSEYELQLKELQESFKQSLTEEYNEIHMGVKELPAEEEVAEEASFATKTKKKVLH